MLVLISVDLHSHGSSPSSLRQTKNLLKSSLNFNPSRHFQSPSQQFTATQTSKHPRNVVSMFSSNIPPPLRDTMQSFNNSLNMSNGTTQASKTSFTLASTTLSRIGSPMNSRLRLSKIWLTRPLVSSYDSRKHERFLEKKASLSHSSGPQNTSSRVPLPAPLPQDHGTTSTGTGGLKIPPTSPDGTVPMELGARHITAAERDRRRANKLCFYCGESGHSVFTCPKKPTGANTKRFAEFSFEDIEFSSFPPRAEKEGTQEQSGGRS